MVCELLCGFLTGCLNPTLTVPSQVLLGQAPIITYENVKGGWRDGSQNIPTGHVDLASFLQGHADWAKRYQGDLKGFLTQVRILDRGPQRIDISLFFSFPFEQIENFSPGFWIEKTFERIWNKKAFEEDVIEKLLPLGIQVKKNHTIISQENTLVYSNRLKLWQEENVHRSPPVKIDVDAENFLRNGILVWGNEVVFSNLEHSDLRTFDLL